jgi:hypothetical protein
MTEFNNVPEVHRHAYQTSYGYETEPEHQNVWHSASQSAWHPHHAHHHLHHLHHATNPESGEHHTATQHHPQEAKLTPAQLQERQKAIAEQQQWDETSGALRHGVKSMFDATANCLKGGYTNVRSGWDNLTDGLTQFTVLNSRQHAAELELSARTEIKQGHIQLADRMLQRDLRFSVSSFGLDDPQTISLAKDLRELHNKHKETVPVQMLYEKI